MPKALSNSCRARALQGRADMDFFDVIRYFGALFLVLALVGVAALMLRRFGLPGITQGKDRRLAVVETLVLGPRHRLLLIRCDATEQLLLVSPQGATHVASQPAKPTFAQALTASDAP